MHILTGLILSRLLAGDKKKKAFRGFRNIVEIRHHIPGRVRFYIPSLINNTGAGHNLEKQLIKADPVKQIKINPVTGTLLIIFEQEQIEVATLTGVIVKLLGLEQEIEKTRPSIVGKELYDILKSANSSLYESSNGFVDLNSLITISFLSLGVYSLLRSPKILPAGLSLMYWAYNNSMRNMGQPCS